MESVHNDDLEFDDEEWEGISIDAINLITKMLDKNPKTRCTASEALQDPWIQKNSRSKPLNSKIFQNLTNFRGDTRFR